MNKTHREQPPRTMISHALAPYCVRHARLTSNLTSWPASKDGAEGPESPEPATSTPIFMRASNCVIAA